MKILDKIGIEGRAVRDDPDLKTFKLAQARVGIERWEKLQADWCKYIKDTNIRSSQIVDIWDIFQSPANAPEVRSQSTSSS